MDRSMFIKGIGVIALAVSATMGRSDQDPGNISGQMETKASSGQQ
jgi:hypothetical protein